MANVIRRRYLGGVAAVVGGLLAAACGEVEVRYVQGPAGPAGSVGVQGATGATGARGSTGAAGEAGKAVVVQKQVVVEKVVEKAAPRLAPKQVVMWSGYLAGRGDQAAAFLRMANQWNNENDDIVLRMQPTVAGKEYSTTRVVTAYNAGVHPHLQHGNYWNATIYGVNGIAVDIQDQFLKTDKEHAESMNDYFPHLRESMYWKGKLWTLNIDTNADLPYTNLNHVRQASLQPLKVGYTWDDLVEYGKTLQTTLEPGEKSNKWAMSHMDNWVVFLNLLKQAGGDLYNKDQTKVVLNSPEGVESLRFLSDLIHKHKIHTPGRDWFEQTGTERPSFRRGQITMYYETSHSRIIAWANDIGGLENFYVSPSPTKKQTFIGTFGQSIHMLKKSPEENETAWQVHRWLSNTDASAEWCSTAMFIPARKSVLEHPLWTKRMEQVPQFLPFVDSLSYGYRPYNPVMFPEHYLVMRGLLSEVVKTPNVAFKDILDQAQSEMTASLESFNTTGKIGRTGI